MSTSNQLQTFTITILANCANTYELQHEISNNVVCATKKGSDQPAHRGSLIRAFASSLNVKLLTEQYFEAYKEAAQAGLFVSKFHIVVNLMSWLIYA